MGDMLQIFTLFIQQVYYKDPGRNLKNVQVHTNVMKKQVISYSYKNMYNLLNCFMS